MFTNRKIPRILLLSLFMLAFLVSGCASRVEKNQPVATSQRVENTPTGEVYSSHGNEIGGYVEVVDALRGAGAQVDPIEEVQQPFFDASGQIIKVNGMDVQVFEFADEAARKAASDQISPDGSSTGTTMINWVDQPNFWAKGRVIVLFVGQDAAIIDLISSVMGEPITTHE